MVLEPTAKSDLEAQWREDSLDAIIDVLRFTGIIMISLIWRTGTPADFVRELLREVIRGSERSDARRGVRRLWGAYDRVGRWIEGMRRGHSAGLHLRPRDNPPFAFHCVAWTHYAILAFCIAFPMMFPRSAGWDKIYLVFIAVVVIHWFVFCGECIFSYVEKTLFYESYEMGTMTNLHWFGEAMPWQMFLVLVLTSVLGINAAIATVFLRNVALDCSVNRCELQITLRLV